LREILRDGTQRWPLNSFRDNDILVRKVFRNGTVTLHFSGQRGSFRLNSS